ncbi:MAG: FHA domain-containing protein [Thermoleophilaceae bacterium]
MELFVLQGPDAGRSFQLGHQSVLGRDPTATVHLLDAEVSRRHAILTAEEGRLRVEDLGSSNGTFVDEQQITGEAEVQAGQRIRVGQTIIEVRAAQPGGDPENMPATKVPLPRPE